MRRSLGATPGAVPWSEWPARGPGWRPAPAVGWCPSVVGRGCRRRRQEADGGAGPAGVLGRPPSYRSRSLLPPACRRRRAGAGWHDAADTHRGQARTRNSCYRTACCDAIDSRRTEVSAKLYSSSQGNHEGRQIKNKNADTDSWRRHLRDTKLAAIWP